jgi:hypothetical protein
MAILPPLAMTLPAAVTMTMPSSPLTATLFKILIFLYLVSSRRFIVIEHLKTLFRLKPEFGLQDF